MIGPQVIRTQPQLGLPAAHGQGGWRSPIQTYSYIGGGDPQKQAPATKHHNQLLQSETFVCSEKNTINKRRRGVRRQKKIEMARLRRGRMMSAISIHAHRGVLRTHDRSLQRYIEIKPHKRQVLRVRSGGAFVSPASLCSQIRSFWTPRFTSCAGITCRSVPTLWSHHLIELFAR